MIERQYIDVSEAEVSPVVRELLRKQKEAYQADKLARAAVVEAMRSEYELPKGLDILAMHYTRWGQLQISVGAAQAAKPKANARPSLTAWLEAQEQSGQRA